MPAEHRVRDALRRVGTAVAFEHRVIAVLEVGPRVRQQLADRLAELLAQFAPGHIEIEVRLRAAGERRVDDVVSEAVGDSTGSHIMASIESIRSAWN